MAVNQRQNPLGWLPSLLIYMVTGALIYYTHYIFAPAYQAATGQPYLVGYLIGWVTNMALVTAASILAYKLEGNPLTWQAFSNHFRLGHMGKTDWLWALAMLLVAAGAYFGLGFTSKWLASIPLFAPHPAFPRDMVTGKLVPGELFGMQLKGQGWIIPVYFTGWVLNILGEEFWYRGWMLPRQELAFGKYAWLVNSLMFTFQHWLQPWNFLAILPGALFAVYAVQRRRNTWLTIIQHGLMNLGLFGVVLAGVIS